MRAGGVVVDGCTGHWGIAPERWRRFLDDDITSRAHAKAEPTS
jgi:hypothetical protein